MTLMVKCKKCGNEFPSRVIQMDEQSFKAATVHGNVENCPQCRGISTYNKEDYFFK